MKKRRLTNDPITPGEKQWISIEKAISMAVITVSGMLKNGDLKEEDYKNNIKKRLKAIQRKYGFNFLREALPGVIRRMELNPNIKMNLNEKGTSVKLRFEYLQEYMNFLEGGKQND